MLKVRIEKRAWRLLALQFILPMLFVWVRLAAVTALYETEEAYMFRFVEDNWARKVGEMAWVLWED